MDTVNFHKEMLSEAQELKHQAQVLSTEIRFAIRLVRSQVQLAALLNEVSTALVQSSPLSYERYNNSGNIIAFDTVRRDRSLRTSASFDKPKNSGPPEGS